MTDEIKKDEVTTETPAEETKPEAKEPTLDELKAMLKAYEDKEEKQKKAISEACADAAEWKRKYRATLDDATREKQEQTDKFAEMQAKIEAYEKRDMVNTYTAKLISAGFDVDQASRMAQGLPAGVPDNFFDEQRAFNEALKQNLKTQTLNSQPSLPIGAAPSSADAKAKEDAMMRSWFGLK